MIDVCKLEAGYGPRTVLGPVDFHLETGQSVLIMGHNGAGKSTLLKTLFGLLPPRAGTANITGLRVPGARPRELIARGVRYLGQGARAFDDLSVHASRKVLTDLYGSEPAPRPNRAARRTTIAKLSVGQRRLEALYLLAAGSPSMWLLDEPTAGVDPAGIAEIEQWMSDQQAQGCALVVIEQDYARFLDRIPLTMVIHSGQMVYLGDSSALRDPMAVVDLYRNAGTSHLEDAP